MYKPQNAGNNNELLKDKFLDLPHEYSRNFPLRSTLKSLESYKVFHIFSDDSRETVFSSKTIKFFIFKRPYGWLQDRLIRTCVRGNVTDIRDAQRVLNYEIHRYKYKQVHSTTQEVPYFRFQRALEEKLSLFREFQVRPPFQSVKDIFCLRVNRTIDPYRRISINNLQLKVNNATPRKRVTLRIYPLNKTISEVRF
jgi:hypothetical protein